MSYVVGIDLGTTSTVAAVCRPGGTAQVVPLEGAAGAVPSAVYLGADGTFLVGEAAQRRALSDPGHVVRDLTRRVGDATPVLVGRRPVSPDELAARFLARLVDDVARREGGVAARVAVTHPAGWGPHRMGALHAALAEQGLGSAMLVPEPVAAATGYAAGARVEPGATVGIYDLGGGRCDATVLRRERDGFVVVGAPEGVEQFGGADLDEVVLAHVRDALGPAWEALDPTDPDVLAAVADLRREATAAKEALSQDTEVLMPVALPGSRTQVRLGRAEFEEMIRPALTETVEAVRRALDGAGDEPGRPGGAGAGGRVGADPARAAAAVGGVRARRDGGARPRRAWWRSARRWWPRVARRRAPAPARSRVRPTHGSGAPDLVAGAGSRPAGPRPATPVGPGDRRPGRRRVRATGGPRPPTAPGPSAGVAAGPLGPGTLPLAVGGGRLARTAPRCSRWPGRRSRRARSRWRPPRRRVPGGSRSSRRPERSPWRCSAGWRRSASSADRVRGRRRAR